MPGTAAAALLVVAATLPAHADSSAPSGEATAAPRSPATPPAPLVSIGLRPPRAGLAAEARSLGERPWYRAPLRRQRALSEQIVDELTDLGNQLGYHLDVLSMDLLALRVDGRRRRVHFGLGAGESGGTLAFRLGSDFHFIDGVAKVTTRIDLCIAGRDLNLELPEVELAPASYRGERGVEVRLPILQRRF